MKSSQNKLGEILAKVGGRPGVSRVSEGLPAPSEARDSTTIPLTPVGRAKNSPARRHSWGDVASHAQILLDMRKARFRRFLSRLGIFVGLPTAVTLIYTLLIATPRYVSEFELTYQSYESSTPLSTGLVQSVMGASQATTVDYGTILYEYIRSKALLDKLNTKLNLRAHYGASTIDYPARLGRHASDDDFLTYYRNRVSVSQGLGGYLTVEVQAFDPQYALTMSKAIISESDDLIDGMSARARQEELQFAEQELTRQEDRLRKARLALEEFRNTHGDLDPKMAASQLGQIVGGIETQLAEARSQLMAASTNLRSDSVQVTQLKTKIAALEEQLRDQRSRLANPAGMPSYSQTLADYEGLLLDEQFASNTYQSASQGLEVARADAARKQNYVVDFAPPKIADRATEPDPGIYTLSAFLLSLLGFGVGSLLIGAFRDQSGM